MSDPHVPRPLRQQFGSNVRLMIAGEDELMERYATNLSDGGLFIQTDSPPPVGSVVVVEFTLPDGQPLSRVAAKVVHSKPALSPGDETAGMGLQFTDLDEVAGTVIERFNAKRPESTPPVSAEPAQQQVGQAINVRQPAVRAPMFSLSGPVVGIDLGTVNSCVACVKGGSPSIITAPGGYQAVPSIVHLNKVGELTVGHIARERMILEPKNAVYGSKRFLGRPFHSHEVRNLGHFFNYELVAGEDGRSAARIGDKLITLEEVAGHILAALKEIAQSDLEQPVQRAVITCPAYFGETQRQAIRDAGRRAGLHVERILNEPTAAAVAYGYGRGLKETILVYDLGGGTFDCSILTIDGDNFKVVASDGDPFLGGADFDDRLTEYALMTFERETGVNLRTETVAVQRLRFAVEMAKHQLSEGSLAQIDLPYVTMTEEGPLDLRLQLERSVLEALTGDLVERTLSLSQRVLDQAGLTAKQIDDVVLVGGQSRSPQVRQMLLERFGRRPRMQVHPDEAVAMGAALIANAVEQNVELDLTDLLPASIRVGKSDGSSAILLGRGTALPAERIFNVDLAQNPTDETRVMLFRGEEETAEDNTLLGVLRLPGKPSGSSAEQGKITLSVSADGLLSVSAQHPDTGKVGELDVLLL